MKQSTDDLAIFGGPPAVDRMLHVGRPNIGDREQLLHRLEGMLDRQWVTNGGPLVQEFEQRIAEFTGVRHCVAVCNATVGLEIAVRALGLAGEVIVPAFTFVATAHALQWLGITPVFCDVDPETHAIDPARVEELISPRTTGIIGVHLWGRACRVDALTEISERRGLTLLFDAAHAFACTHQGRMVGSFGAAEVFSFHATKFLNSFEGGAIATNDDVLAERIRLMKTFGFLDYDRVVELGTNGKMNEAAAAMGLTSLDSMERFIAVNRRNYEAYGRGLAGIPGVSLLRYPRGDRYNYHYIILEIDAFEAGLSRDQLHAIMHAENVLVRRYFHPGCHRMEPYRSSARYSALRLPVTDQLSERVLCLPTGTAVSEQDILSICETLRFAVLHAHQVGELLDSSPSGGAVPALRGQQ